MQPPPELAALREDVERGLERYLDRALPRLDALHPTLAPVADELRAFVLGGGKRLRPLCLLLGHRAVGGDPADVLGPALALELLHTCALVHDDVIDAAGTRRGRPTVHRRFASEHPGGRGDADAFGVAAAILAGDLAFVLADELFLDAAVPAPRLLAGLRTFVTLREEVMAGQYLDVLAAQQDGIDREVALTVASLKSGRYTIARPLQVGAVLGGGDDDAVTGLLAFGEPLGQAFQLRDDVLGVFGTEDETGKSVASDLHEGKRTVLVAETITRLDPGERERFGALLGADELTTDGEEELRHLMRSSGGLDATLATVDELRDTSLAALARLDLEPDTRGALEKLVGFVVDRRA